MRAPSQTNTVSRLSPVGEVRSHHAGRSILRSITGAARLSANAHKDCCGLTKLQAIASADDTINKVSAMRRLHLTETGYAFPLQLWPQAIRAGLRITEIPVRLIYNDPSRSFGGVLDDAARRLKHYLSVFNAEMAVPVDAGQPEKVPCPCC